MGRPRKTPVEDAPPVAKGRVDEVFVRRGQKGWFEHTAISGNSGISAVNYQAISADLPGALMVDGKVFFPASALVELGKRAERKWGRPDAIDPSLMTPQERKAHFEAEIKQRQLAEIDGELIQRSVVVELLSEVVKAVKNPLMTMAAVMERDDGLTGKQVDAVEMRARLALELAREVLIRRGYDE